MKFSSLFLAGSLIVLPACAPSEIADKPAAEVTTTVATDTAAAPAQQAEGVTANVVKEKSSVQWVGAKVTRDHDGGFRNFDGTITYAGGQPQRVSFDIDLESIYSDDERLTGHLKSPDFFDVATYPKATFTSTSLTPAPAGSPEGATHILEGTLDLHGVQKGVRIPVKAETTAEGVRTTSEFTINRQDWGISYRGMADDLIKDNVLIKLDLLFPPPPAGGA